MTQDPESLLLSPRLLSRLKRGAEQSNLTPSQIAIAKRLNVPLEEYAKYVKE